MDDAVYDLDLDLDLLPAAALGGVLDLKIGVKCAIKNMG